MMKTQIDNLILLARDFRKFSWENYDWNTKYYLNSKVRCYFSNDNEHTSITIDWVVIYFYEDVIKVEFTNPANISIKRIENLVKKYSKKLKELENVCNNSG